jgi:hypothetical protein
MKLSRVWCLVVLGLIAAGVFIVARARYQELVSKDSAGLSDAGESDASEGAPAFLIQRVDSRLLPNALAD